MQYVLFTDNLASLKIADVCREAKRAGFDGLDLTMRGGGHVPPEKAEVGLAEAKRVADAEGVTIPMVTSGVTDVDTPHAEAVFAAAAHYGARHIKLGYWRYEPFGTILKQIDDARAKLERLAKLAEKYNVVACVHVHSGNVLANGGPMLYLILRGFEAAKHVGAYVDPMHMTAEGGIMGWEMGLDLLAPWVALVGVKNFRWKERGRDDKGQLRFAPEYVALQDGQAPLPDFVARLRQLKYDGVVSLHSEYKGITVPELLEQSRKDLAYFKTL
jgi:sugar phosphate isomerase/epimerase